jgi:hypothetical protein
MWKSLAAIATAAVIAGALTGFPNFGFVEPVSATSTAGVPAIAAPGCPERGWPYRQCDAKAVRLIALDRFPAR